MIGRTNTGGGGAALNYMVVGGISAPASPAENTIWINTGTDISSHIFSATEPSSPESGMVWIRTGAASAAPFSATEENPIMVYPIAAKQYVNGAWVSVSLKIYINGSWVTLGGTSYWFKQGEGPTDTWNTYGGTAISLSTSGMQMYGDYGASGRRISSKTKVDLTGFNTLFFEGYSDGYAHGTFGVASAIPADDNITFAESVSDGGTRAVLQLDVSELTGEYYIALKGTGAGSTYVYNIYGE